MINEIGFESKDGTFWKDLLKSKIERRVSSFDIHHKKKDAAPETIEVKVKNKFQYHDKRD